MTENSKDKVLSKIKEIESRIKKINKELNKEQEHIDDAPWEIPAIGELEIRKRIYEKRLEDLKEKLRI